MKTFEILYTSPGTNSSPELYNYLHSRIDQIGKDFTNIERCEVVLGRNSDIGGDFEVRVRIYVPRHVYVAKENKTDFRHAVQTVFDDLSHQLNELKERMYDKAIYVEPVI